MNYCKHLWPLILFIFLVQCKTASNNHTASFGGRFDNDLSVTSISKMNSIDTANSESNLQKHCESEYLLNDGVLISEMANGKKRLSEKMTTFEISKAYLAARTNKAGAPQQTQGGSALIGYLFIGAIIVLFFYLFFLLFTALGWVSMPFWKALLYFAGVVLFLMIFMMY